MKQKLTKKEKETLLSKFDIVPDSVKDKYYSHDLECDIYFKSNNIVDIIKKLIDVYSDHAKYFAINDYKRKIQQLLGLKG